MATTSSNVLLLIVTFISGALLSLAISSGNAVIWILIYGSLISILLRWNVRERPALCILALPFMIAVPFFAAYFDALLSLPPSPAIDGWDAKLHVYDSLFTRLFSITQSHMWGFIDSLLAVLAALSTYLLLVNVIFSGRRLVDLISQRRGDPTSISFLWYSDTLPRIIGVTIVLGQFVIFGMVNGLISPDALGTLDRIVQTPRPVPVIIAVVSVWTTAAIFLGAIAIWGATRSSRSFFDSIKK